MITSMSDTEAQNIDVGGPLTPEKSSINGIEDEIEPGASSENRTLVVNENSTKETWQGETELHISNSDGIRTLARLMRSVSVKGDSDEALLKLHRTKSEPHTSARRHLSGGARTPGRQHPSDDPRTSSRRHFSGAPRVNEQFPVAEEDFLAQTDTHLTQLDNEIASEENGGAIGTDYSDTPTTSMTSEISDVGLYSPGDSRSLSLTESDIEGDLLSSETWRYKPRHFFVLTEAGKPVYSRHGCEDKLSPLMGVLLALVSCVYDRKDTMRFVVAGEHKFVFLARPPLILVGICSTRESVHQVNVQLTYIYNTIISVLTHSQLSKIYETKKNFDLRRLLTGTDKFLNNLCVAMDNQAQFLLQAVQCLRINGNTRDIIGQALQQSKTEDLAFALLISNNQIVNICRLREHSIHPADLHLMLNLVSSSATAFHTGESWTPICLPNFNPHGFLHAHISYLDDDCSTCLILLSADRDSFFTLSDAKNRVLAKLRRHACLESLRNAGKRESYTVNSIGIAALRHFIYKSKSTSQFTWPEIGFPYITDEEKRRIFGLYQHTHGRVHDSSCPLKLLYLIWETETILGWVTSGFELYAVFSPLVSKTTAIGAVNLLLRWIKRNEDELFILRPPIF